MSKILQSSGLPPERHRNPSRKLPLLLCAAFTIFANSLCAQTPAQASSQEEAVKLFPGLAYPDSKISKRFLEIYNLAKAMNDPVLSSPNLPMLVAKQAHAEIHSGAKPIPTEFFHFSGVVTVASAEPIILCDEKSTDPNIKFARGTHVICVGNLVFSNGKLAQVGQVVSGAILAGETFVPSAVDENGKPLMGRGAPVRSIPIYHNLASLLSARLNSLEVPTNKKRPIINPESASTHVGETVTLTGAITGMRLTAEGGFLQIDYHMPPFTVTLRRDLVPELFTPVGKNWLEANFNRQVTIIGKIESSNGGFGMTLSSRSNLNTPILWPVGK
jgi:hypothetical protein